MINKITEEHKTAIVELWKSGMSGGDIADKIGLTRNSVLGAIHRMRKNGIELEDRKGTTGFKVKKPRPWVKKKTAIIPPKYGSPVDILGLKMNSCRFIVEMAGENSKYCNKEISKSSYCKDHYKICYIPARN